MASQELVSSFDQRRRVVITGMGVVAPCGIGLDAFWKNIREGNSGAGPMTRFEIGDSPTRIAAEIKNFEPERIVKNPKIVKRLHKSHLYGLCAATLAANDAGIALSEINPDRIGIAEGTTVSNNEGLGEMDENFFKKGYKAGGLHTIRNSYSGAGAGEIACELDIKGHCITISTSSASGNDVIGYALNMIRNEDVDVMVAGGTEAPILPHVWGPLCFNKVMTRYNDDPQSAMRPFDASRNGMVLGEGAAYVVMEELSHALARGAKIYCEVLGHGRSCEAYHPVAPHPEGIGYRRAMEKALREAMISVDDIDYINAHGTATEANDVVETKAIKKVFGSRAKEISISSTKPITGHLMAAAGAIESVITALGIYHQEVPPTINLHNPDPECDLDYVPNQSRPYPIRVALNLNSGFGGKNSCLVLRKYKT